MDLAEHTGSAATSAAQDSTQNDGSEVFDLTIIGAGPTGLYGAFYAGMRELKTKIIDALEEPGGQLAALYPEKYIYDAPGHPKILAKDLVTLLVEQAEQWHPQICLGERVQALTRLEDGTIRLSTNKGDHLTKSVVICAGVGAFAPNKLAAPGVDAFEGECVYY